MLRTADLDYHLPEDLIATEPASPRDSARLMVLRRAEPGRIEHRVVRDLPEFLGPGDLLVVNRTHVLPARFRGVRTDTGGRAEGLFIAERGARTAEQVGLCWQVLLKLRRARPGAAVRVLGADGESTDIRLVLLERVGAESGDDAGGWLVRVEGAGERASTQEVLDRIGLTPLPPYILAARKRHEQAGDDRRDREVYQTVYAAADPDEAHGRGSVAAPTAGLHFTPGLLGALTARGVERAGVVLHVGMGTFKPVETEFVEQHPMHSEWCLVPRETAAAVGARVGSGTRGRTVAVGTTSARTLESFASPEEMAEVGARDTRLLITPGHRFRHVGALMTNFHLPRSTLLAMVAAFLDDDDRVRGGGLERMLEAYQLAVEQRYRFYSFGDAMLILP